MKVKSESEVTQSCPTLSDPMDWSLPGSSVNGIFQARVLEWGAIGLENSMDCIGHGFAKSQTRLSDFSLSAGIPSPPLALFVVVLPKAHLTSHSKISGPR